MPETYRQIVPRPNDACRGDPAPWTTLPAARRSSIPVERLRRGLAHLATTPAPSPPVHSAVLVPVVVRGGEAALVLIRRSAALERDAGNLAFPGGHLEPGEEPLGAALRESQEEIGLDPGLVEVIGSFAVVERVWGRERVVPFVGVVTGHPDYVADGHEVAAILEVPLASLVADGVSWQERWDAPGRDAGVCFFAGTPELADDLIWGLTARIVWDLLAAVVAET
ncbi:MAG: NUDIX hydrolase [Acidimicrobiales bacterium]